MPTSTTNAASANAMGSGVTALAAGFASLQAASAQARQFKIQGTFLALAASAEKLKARENTLFLRKKFLSNIGSANASLSGRGVSTSSGIGRKMAIEGLKNLGRDEQAVALNSDAIQNSLTLQSSQSRLAEKTARNTGLLKASTSFGKGSNSLLSGFSTIKTGGSDVKE